MPETGNDIRIEIKNGCKNISEIPWAIFVSRSFLQCPDRATFGSNTCPICKSSLLKPQIFEFLYKRTNGDGKYYQTGISLELVCTGDFCGKTFQGVLLTTEFVDWID